MFAKGVPHMTHHTRDVQCVRPSRDDPGCIVSFRFETYDLLRGGLLRHFVAHSPLSELGVAPEEHPVLLANVLWDSKTYRGRMMQVMFETINVPVTFVTIQAVSVHFETHDGHRVGHLRSCVAHSFDQRCYTLPLPSFVLHPLPHEVLDEVPH